MIDLLLPIGLSNLLTSGVIAVVAWTVQRVAKRPAIAHVLWLLVLVKLVTPPLFDVPFVSLPSFAASSIETATAPELLAGPGLSSSAEDGGLQQRLAGVEVTAGASSAADEIAWLNGFVVVWLLGSLGVLAGSLLRIFRFHRLLGLATETAPARVQSLANDVSRRLGLASTPTVYTTHAHLSPMVWWIGGPVRVVIPSIVTAMDTEGLRWVLAHELAHVRRRDHMVRWLEWVACVGFWWNPVAWWARRQLRANEEICCDALVLSTLRPAPAAYANSLLTVIEHLAFPILRPPAVASEMNGGGFLERRFTWIVSGEGGRPTPRWMHGALVIAAVAWVPCGVGHARPSVLPENGTSEMGTPASGEASKGALAALGSDDDARAKIAAALEASGLTGERLREALGAIKKVVLEMRAEGEAFEMSPELEAFLLDELELSERQFELVVTIAARVSGGERRRLRGDIEALLPRLESTFLDHGFGAAQIDVVFEVLPKLVASIRAEKVELELGEAWQRYFERAGLDDDQIAVVVRVARGVAQRMNSKPTRPKRWVTAALKEGGLQPKQIDAVVGLLKKIVRGIAARGEVAKIGPRTHDFLVNRIGLTDAQIARVLAVAVRMADEEKTRRERASLAEHYAKWGIDDAGMERIRAACASRAFEAEQTEAVLRALLRIVPSLLSATDEPAIAPRLHAYLVDEVKLTERQIEFVLGMARRLAVAADPEGRRRRS